MMIHQLVHDMYMIKLTVNSCYTIVYNHCISSSMADCMYMIHLQRSRTRCNCICNSYIQKIYSELLFVLDIISLVKENDIGNN